VKNLQNCIFSTITRCILATDFIAFPQIGDGRYTCISCPKLAASRNKKEICIHQIESNLSLKEHHPIVGKIMSPFNALNTVETIETELQEDFDEETVIDHMFLYTDDVMDEYGSDNAVKATISYAVAKSNEIFKNNEIKLNIQVAYWGRTDFNKTGNKELSLNYVLEDKSVRQFRDEFSADFVTMITNDSATGSHSFNPNPVSRHTEYEASSVIEANNMLAILPEIYGYLFGLHSVEIVFKFCNIHLRSS
jgi:hypothetical protein